MIYTRHLCIGSTFGENNKDTFQENLEREHEQSCRDGISPYSHTSFQMSAFQSDTEQNASRPEMSVFPHKSSSGWEDIFNGIQQSSNNYILNVSENSI